MNPLRNRSRLFDRCWLVWLSLVLSGTVMAAVAGPANAQRLAAPASCPPDAAYSTFGAVGTWVGDPSRKITGWGPMSLTLTVYSSDSVTGTIGGSGGYSVTAIIFTAQAEINGSIATTVTSGASYAASVSVPSGVYEWLQWGSWGYHYNWNYGAHNGACQWIVSAWGTATSPTITGKGFNHGTG